VSYQQFAGYGVLGKDQKWVFCPEKLSCAFADMSVLGALILNNNLL